MVKFFLAFLLACSSLFANESTSLDATLKSVLGAKVYAGNKGLVDTVFRQKGAFYDGNRVDIAKVLKALKENRVINLSLKSPQEIILSFSTKGSPTFFVKVLSDALRKIGTYKYLTKESSMNGSTFVWSIQYVGDSVIDPVSLNTELVKSGCSIVDAKIETPTSWSYEIRRLTCRSKES